MAVTEVPASEPIDRVPGQPDVTAWRRAARRHQSQWREKHGWPPGRQRQSAEQGGGYRPIGSRVENEFARRSGVNFISEAARRAVAERLDRKNREPHETLDEERLFCDLLSSMPMCFNLFGPLWADKELASAVAHRWFPSLCPLGAEVEVRFEWSPGRSDPRWLGDRTAFDAAFLIREGGSTTLIGIETKYHEYAAVVPVVRRRRGVEERREPNDRYLEVTKAAGLFLDADWIDRVWGHDVEQVWRDHLLAHAWRQASKIDSEALYVLVAPSANPAWSRLAEKYAGMLAEASRSTFQYRSLDGLLDDATDLLPHAMAFRDRYLAVSLET